MQEADEEWESRMEKALEGKGCGCRHCRALSESGDGYVWMDAHYGIRHYCGAALHVFCMVVCTSMCT